MLQWYLGPPNGHSHTNGVCLDLEIDSRTVNNQTGIQSVVYIEHVAPQRNLCSNETEMGMLSLLEQIENSLQ